MNALGPLMLLAALSAVTVDDRPQRLPDLADQVFDSNGVRIRFVEHGHGPAVHPIRNWTRSLEDEAEASARDLESDTPFRALVLGASPDARPSQAEIRRLSDVLVAANDPKALAAYHRGLHTLAVTDAGLAAVRVPTLAIIGSVDPALAGVRELKSIMPALSIAVIDGAEHGGERGVLRRHEFLGVLRDFLAARH